MIFTTDTFPSPEVEKCSSYHSLEYEKGLEFTISVLIAEQTTRE